MCFVLALISIAVKVPYVETGILFILSGSIGMAASAVAWISA